MMRPGDITGAQAEIAEVRGSTRVGASSPCARAGSRYTYHAVAIADEWSIPACMAEQHVDVRQTIRFGGTAWNSRWRELSAVAFFL